MTSQNAPSSPPAITLDSRTSLLALQLIAASLGNKTCSEEDALRKELNRLARIPAPDKEAVMRIENHLQTLAALLPANESRTNTPAKINWIQDQRKLRSAGLIVRWEKCNGRLHELYRHIFLLAQYQCAECADAARRQAPLLLCAIEDRRQEQAAMSAMQNPQGIVVVSFSTSSAARERFRSHAERNCGVLVELPSSFSPNLLGFTPKQQNLPLYLEPCAAGILSIGLRCRGEKHPASPQPDRAIPALFRALARCRPVAAEPRTAQSPA